MNIGMRHISLSTCGLIKGIDRLAEENLQLTLSVSLHAPDDETRMQPHAGEPGHGGGHALRGLPPVFPKDGAAHLL